ncbi:hypothetical protein EGR_11098 [Echinococcus granulosus]|uniref:Uncharacterized protein n=1 Tax=Echinococcus granulosus TaxID=6210 RepID=W6TZ93_ECHGR|nr:hypothetical protein EGR_11098 [Echinococcus granulosus]EUB54043.1 hypothetical protein EGR_11098 [Echinococcus granulosus]
MQYSVVDNNFVNIAGHVSNNFGANAKICPHIMHKRIDLKNAYTVLKTFQTLSQDIHNQNTSDVPSTLLGCVRKPPSNRSTLPIYHNEECVVGGGCGYIGKDEGHMNKALGSIPYFMDSSILGEQVISYAHDSPIKTVMTAFHSTVVIKRIQKMHKGFYAALQSNLHELQASLLLKTVVSDIQTY